VRVIEKDKRLLVLFEGLENKKKVSEYNRIRVVVVCKESFDRVGNLENRHVWMKRVKGFPISALG